MVLSKEFIEQLKFSPDKFQSDAFEAIDENCNVVVSAPTGSGKTLVAEYGAFKALGEGNKLIYTTPVKALSNQKYNDLVLEHGEAEVGLLTGDNSINSEASIVVMTTEVLRNMIYSGKDFDKLAYVVLDEVHYLQDAYRGSVWEEVIIHLDKKVKLICLSATVSNADQLANWIGDVRGTTKLTTMTKRPVELTQFYLAKKLTSKKLEMIKVLRGDKTNADGFQLDNKTIKRSTKRGMRTSQIKKWAPPSVSEVADHLEANDMLPAIHFIFSRNQCDIAAREHLATEHSYLSEAESKQALAIVDDICGDISDEVKLMTNFTMFRNAIGKGIAAHHAGLLPVYKRAVEKCFIEGCLKLVYATETLALGINMPARTVVIDKLTKYNGEGHQMLTPSQFSQLCGRAGRRGIDEVGYSVCLWSKFISFKQVAALTKNKDFNLTSSFKPNFNMVANLIASHTQEETESLLNLSFAQYQTNETVVVDYVSDDRLKQRQDKIVGQLKKFGKIEELVAQENPKTKRKGGKKNSGRKPRTRALPPHAKKLLKRYIQIEEKLKKAEKEKARSIADQLNDIIDVTDYFGFTDKWEIKPKGELLSRVHHESDLLIAEVLSTDILDNLNPAELAGVVSIFSYEERGSDASEPWFPSTETKDAFKKIALIVKSIDKAEKKVGLSLTSGIDPGFIHIAHGWAAGGDIDDVLGNENIGLGDFNRVIKLVIDLLRQIANIAPNTQLRSTARAALKEINRDFLVE